MVKLPPVYSRPTRRVMMYQYCNGNMVLDKIPTKLMELESLAEAASQHMTLFSIPVHRQYALNQLRQYFNLEFKLRCHECGTAHYQDEITAPER